ncbi:hypothetical protein C8R46DRAFT_1206230 [Mycena filopes]|nr:hypothetical protein C8R46DRAFT_1206230 [Mycena filopes]
MSSEPAAIAPAAEIASRRHRYSSFPAAPPDATIVPFEAFAESGPRVVGGDGIERDGLGIPTIVLRNSGEPAAIAPPAETPRSRHRFPPFPPTPPNATIVPFEAFEESGPRVVGGDGIERDGLGIPTVVLRHREEPKTERKRRPGAPRRLKV